MDAHPSGSCQRQVADLCLIRASLTCKERIDYVPELGEGSVPAEPRLRASPFFNMPFFKALRLALFWPVENEAAVRSGALTRRASDSSESSLGRAVLSLSSLAMKISSSCVSDDIAKECVDALWTSVSDRNLAHNLLSRGGP